MSWKSAPILLVYVLLASLVVGSVAIANAAHGLVKEPGEGGIPWAITEDRPLLHALDSPATVDDHGADEPRYNDGEGCTVPLEAEPSF